MGAIETAIPPQRVHEVLRETEWASVRHRLPRTHLILDGALRRGAGGVNVCFWRGGLRCLLDGLQWLAKPSRRLRMAAYEAISRAPHRLGREDAEASALLARGSTGRAGRSPGPSTGNGER